MKHNQLTQGQKKRVMYIENKEGELYGSNARIVWVTFSKTGRTVYYKDKALKRSGGQGIRGNHYDEETGEEYWISGVKKRGSNTHWAESVSVLIDEDAVEEYNRMKSK